MSAPNSGIRQALEMHLAAMPDCPPVAWQNHPLPTGSDLGRLRATLVPTATRRESFGTPDPRMEDSGLFLVDVLMPDGIGSGAAEMLAARLRDHFRPGLNLQRGDVIVRLIEASVAQGRNVPEGAYLVPVTVTWRVYWTA